MARHSQHTDRKRGRTVVAASFAVAGLAITGAGVYAGLNATATGTQAVSSGTLKLSLANDGVGFSQSVSNLAPGDTVNRYVTLTNDGSLAAQNLTLAAADTVDSKLTTDATKGLQVTVKKCVDSVLSTGAAWNVTTGACTGSLLSGLPGTTAGTVQTLATAVPLSSLQSAATTLIAGAVAAGDHQLQLSLVLPDQDETTTNGTLPASTIQGLSAALTWTFDQAQRTATTTNS